MSGVERHYIASGAGFYEPMRYSELPRYYYDHITPPDVAMFQVTPMDSHGYFNFGLSASHVRAVCEKAKVVIVEVNENMPRCLGGFDNTHPHQRGGHGRGRPQRPPWAFWRFRRAPTRWIRRWPVWS